MEPIIPHLRFRSARERLGLSPDDLNIPGISSACIGDIEEFEGELGECYSIKELQRFCEVLKVHPIELFADDFSESAISPAELVQRIHEECRLRAITLQKFEDVVGWQLSQSLDPPKLLLEDMTIDGMQWLCRELRLDWRRTLIGL